MKLKFGPKVLAAKIGLLMSLTASATGIPVIDAGNLAQNTNTAMQSVMQTLKQLDEYATQLQQYEDQLTNTLAPAAYVWDQANQVMSRVTGLVSQVQAYKQMAGSLPNYLNKYQDAGYYRNSPCFGPKGCSAAERAKLNDSAWTASTAQKKANDAVWKGLDQQEIQLKADASNLTRLQQQATAAGGRMQAIQAGVQLASNQSAQLLQIRTLLLQQQQMEAAQAQAKQDQQAKELAAHRQSTLQTVKAGLSDKI